MQRRLFILILLSVFMLSSCITPLKNYEGKDDHIKGTAEEASVISETPNSKNNSITIGFESLKLQAGYDGRFLLKNQSRVEVSTNYNFGNASGDMFLSDSEQINYTNKRLTESVGISLNYSYPITKNTKTKKAALDVDDGTMPKMGTRAMPSSGGGFSSVPAPIEDTVYYVSHNYKIISTFDAKVGVDHLYSQFGSEFYKRHLNQTYPEGEFRFPDTFDDVIINSGSYYLKLGGSYNNYVNSRAKTEIDGKKLSGRLSREFQINAFVNVDLFSTIASTDFIYSEFENGEFVEKSDFINPANFLKHLPIGGEISTNLAVYFHKKFALSFSISLGVAPGYFDEFHNRTFLGAKVGFGLGRFIEKNKNK